VPGRIKVLFVSRDEGDIRKILSSASVLRLTESSNYADIEAYTTCWAAQIKAKFGLSDALEESIKSAVCENSKGMVYTHGKI